MRFNQLLPLILLAAVAACSKGGGESTPANNTPAAENIAPAASMAPTPADHPAAAPAAPAAENAAAAPATAATAAPASGQPASAATPAGSGDLAKGEQVFNSTCQACHGSGVMGAPKVGDKAAWGPRIAQGKETLYQHALNGIRMMPAHGGNPALADGDVKSAVDFMVSKAQ